MFFWPACCCRNQSVMSGAVERKPLNVPCSLRRVWTSRCWTCTRCALITTTPMWDFLMNRKDIIMFPWTPAVFPVKSLFLTGWCSVSVVRFHRDKFPGRAGEVHQRTGRLGDQPAAHGGSPERHGRIPVWQTHSWQREQLNGRMSMKLFVCVYLHLASKCFHSLKPSAWHRPWIFSHFYIFLI